MTAVSETPEAAEPTNATTATTDSEKLARSLAAENLIKDYVIASVAASIVPVPLFDIAAVVGIELRMIQKLSELYGKPFAEAAGRSVIAALAGGVFGYGAGLAVAVSLTKLIPGVGWMMGMVSLPALAGGSTYAVGRVFVKHYENGGDIFDLSAETMHTYYKEQLERGKKLIAKNKLAKKAPVAKDELSDA
jgi:uncharacterized protein (DUF697 family)